MRSIRITSTPPGQAPLEIREKWIGVIIPLIQQNTKGIQVGVAGGQPENVGGYRVNPREAVNCLAKTSPEASSWWNENFPVDSALAFAFSKDVCELIEE